MDTRPVSNCKLKIVNEITDKILDPKSDNVHLMQRMKSVIDLTDDEIESIVDGATLIPAGPDAQTYRIPDLIWNRALTVNEAKFICLNHDSIIELVKERMREKEAKRNAEIWAVINQVFGPEPNRTDDVAVMRPIAELADLTELADAPDAPDAPELPRQETWRDRKPYL